MDIDNPDQPNDTLAPRATRIPDSSIPRATPGLGAESSDPNKEATFLTSIKNGFAHLIRKSYDFHHIRQV